MKNNKEEIISIAVNVKPSKKEGKSTDVEIGLPKEQRPLGINEGAHILAAGISLLVRSHKTSDEGARLMKSIIEHLNSEFLSVKSFDDALLNEKHLKYENGSEEKSFTTSNSSQKKSYNEQQVLDLLIRCKDTFGSSDLDEYTTNIEVHEWFKKTNKDEQK